MKIGIYLPNLTPDSGGAFTFYETVISGLITSGSEDHFVVFHDGPSAALKKSFPGKIDFHSLSSSSASRRIGRALDQWVRPFLQTLAIRLKLNLKLPVCFPAVSRLDAAARKCRIDLMWFPTPGSEPVECPYAITIWDLEHRHQPYLPEVSAHGEWDARERYFARVLKRASYVVTGTEIGKQEIIRCYGVEPGRIRILPHPTPSFALEAQTRMTLPESLGLALPYLVYPAQFWAHKNHILLLEVLAELKKRGQLVQLALLGSDKGNRAHVESCAKKMGIADRVKFLGFVSREELIALYQNALALTYASFCGPENLPPLEAMALGCPVLASEFSGSQEQLGSAAILLNPRDPLEWADAIDELLKNPRKSQSLRELGQSRARRYTQKEFIFDMKMLFDDFRWIRKLWG